MMAIAHYVAGWSKNVKGLVKSAYGTPMNRLRASSSAKEKLSSNRNDGTSCSRIFWLQPQSRLPYSATLSINTTPDVQQTSCPPTVLQQ